MTNNRLFTYQSTGDFDKHQVIHVDDSAKAEELIGAGKAVRLDLPDLNRMEQAADNIHETYKREVAEIKASDNPLMTEEVKAYEIDKLDKKMREDSAQIEQEFTDWRQTQVADAKKRAARTVIKTTDSDREVASQFVTRASLNLASAYDDDKGALVDSIVRDVAHLSDAEKTAMQSEVGRLLGDLSTSEKRKLVDAVNDIRNEDLLAVHVAEQLPRSVLTKRRISDISKKVASESVFAGESGSIDKEFYDKYLKGDRK